MRRVLIASAVVAGVASSANAQFSTANPAPTKKASVTTVGTPGSSGWLNEDDCNNAHRAAGSGDVFGVPFVTGTTGTDGQNEANCYFFATTAIDNDTWWNYTATADGNASISTCAGTSVDTKIAVYPGGGGCPADGTSLACNDDACGFQSTTVWSATSGTRYTIQLGTFPGATGGSGTFDITVTAPPPCGMYDDGTSENALGLTNGGETGWMHYIDCLETIDDVSTAYGTPGGTGPNNGNPSIIAVYEDADCDADPTTGPPALLFSVATVVANNGTDVFNPNPTGGVNIGSRCSWVMATSTQIAGQFPGPMDQTNPTPNAWVVGASPTGSTMDIANINNNNVAPLQMQAIGFPAAWLLRASGTESSGDGPGTPECFGATGCPCGNNGDGTGGCQNSLNSGGAVLSASGSATVGAGDTLNLIATRTTNQPGIFFQGNDSLANPPLFGDGFRCCGNGVVRIGTYLPAANMTDTDTGNQIGGVGPPISGHPGNSGLMPGDSRCYQWWYRDPQGPCGFQFNLSNATSVDWN